MSFLRPPEPAYELFDPIASGGMAVVHLGRRRGAAGFSRVVAVKRLHPHLAGDPDVAAMLMDEAKLSARVRHTNVVSVLDVVEDGGLALVMEYVHGASLSQLVRAASEAGERVPPEVASAIVIGALAGLHAAHEATGDDGAPLHLVHRDVSPQNILVGADGAPRIVDFGVAKARVRAHVTREGTLKGKLAYMAPEQLSGQATRRTDVLAAGVVLWELLAGRRLYDGVADDVHLIGAVSMRPPPPLASFAPELPPALSDLVERALQKDPEQRFATASEMADALRAALPPAPPTDVGAWVARLAGPGLARRAALIARIERGDLPPPASVDPTDVAPSQGTTRPAAPAALTSSAAGPSGPPPPETGGTVTIDPLARRGAAGRTARWRRAGWLGAALLLTALLVAGARVVSGGQHDGTEYNELTASPSASSTPTTAPSAEETAGSAGAPSVAAVPAGVPSEPAATGPVRGSSEPIASPSISAPSTRPRIPAPTSSRSTLAAKPGCDPPWEKDERGIKRVKKGCLQ